MKYFIDFEATQFTNEIIEIGCINEYGDVFHSYVKAKKKLTSFITNLTGITQDLINEAPSTDEVFENFFEWLNKFNNEEEMCFFCYGDTDLTFIKKNLQNTKSYKARIALSLLGMNLFNYATKVQEELELSKSISLIKLYHYYIDAEAEQKHCALDDAIYLREVFLAVGNDDHKERIFNNYPEYQIGHDSPNKNHKLTNNDIDKLTNVYYNKKIESGRQRFDDFLAAVDYIYETCFSPMQRAQVNKITVAKHLRTALNLDKNYFGRKWRYIN